MFFNTIFIQAIGCNIIKKIKNNKKKKRNIHIGKITNQIAIRNSCI